MLVAASNSYSTHSPHTRRTMNIHKAYMLPTIIGNSTYGLGLTRVKRGVVGSTQAEIVSLIGS